MVIDPGTVLPALIGATATVIGALLVWQSKRSDKAAQTLDLALRNLGERVAEQDTKITRLTERLDASERARREQDRVIRKLEDRERDREELIQDFLARHLLVDEWFHKGGYSPPLPDPTWRITQAVEQYVNEQKDVNSRGQHQ